MNHTLAALGVVLALAWAYMAHLAAAMGRMNAAMVMPQTHPWSMAEIFWLVVMWAVMMTAMMIPSAAPTVRAAPPVVFVAGYLFVWIGYSLLAALAQTELHAAALLSPLMASATPLFGASLLLAAGIYQLIPLKQRCLMHCRSPVGFTSE